MDLVLDASEVVAGGMEGCETWTWSSGVVLSDEGSAELGRLTLSSGPGSVEGTATELAIGVQTWPSSRRRWCRGTPNRSIPTNWPSSASLEESMKSLRSAAFLAISWKVSIAKGPATNGKDHLGPRTGSHRTSPCRGDVPLMGSHLVSLSNAQSWPWVGLGCRVSVVAVGGGCSR